MDDSINFKSPVPQQQLLSDSLKELNSGKDTNNLLSQLSLLQSPKSNSVLRANFSPRAMLKVNPIVEVPPPENFNDPTDMDQTVVMDTRRSLLNQPKN